MVDHLWLIPAAPLLVSLIILSLDKSMRRLAAALAIAGQLVAFVLAVLAFIPTLATPGFRAFHNFTWFTFGDQALRIGWLLDPLTAAMLMMITFVALWIFVFSVGYMADDKDYTRFFAYLSFFTAAMLGVVIANSLLLLFVCWELVGLASYLLIGFWIERPSAAAAAKKAFITTRIGDIGFFLGLLWLYGRTGTTLFYDNGSGSLEGGGLALIGAS
ncbi:MAG: NADH-quinone oxidoreductase subunit L, partial [Verrucomicrobiota bacterium]|nr:NADH-quinone oxidoreductase subunit L [Verrucomicrobiota bacterium]